MHAYVALICHYEKSAALSNLLIKPSTKIFDEVENIYGQG